MDRAGRVTVGPFMVLADINQQCVTIGAETLSSSLDCNFLDASFRVVDDFQKSFRVFHGSLGSKVQRLKSNVFFATKFWTLDRGLWTWLSANDYNANFPSH